MSHILTLSDRAVIQALLSVGHAQKEIAKQDRFSDVDVWQKHELNWPNDAYYVVMYRQQALWAFHREAAIDLYDYLKEDLRDHKKYRHSFFLLHIPTIFKQKKARVHVTKQLQNLLKNQ